MRARAAFAGASRASHSNKQHIAPRIIMRSRIVAFAVKAQSQMRAASYGGAALIIKAPARIKQ